MPPPALRSPLQPLEDELFVRAGVRVLLKRDDLIDGAVTGNKWRKLRYTLDDVVRSGSDTMLTFGGPYSNHLRAVAAAGEALGLRTVGVVRGEEHLPLNWSLAEATSRGMVLDYLDRDTYRRKSEPGVLADLRARHGDDVYVIPEGGSGPLGVLGCRDIGEEIPDDADVVLCPCGTGGTLAGLAAGLRGHQHAIGIAVLKGAAFLVDEVAELQQRAGLDVPRERWSVDIDHHYGGFAKSNPGFDEFRREFERRHALTLESIYVAKMMAALYDLVESGRISRGATVVAVITGGPEPG